MIITSLRSLSTRLSPTVRPIFHHLEQGRETEKPPVKYLIDLPDAVVKAFDFKTLFNWVFLESYFSILKITQSYNMRFVCFLIDIPNTFILLQCVFIIHNPLLKYAR